MDSRHKQSAVNDDDEDEDEVGALLGNDSPRNVHEKRWE